MELLIQNGVLTGCRDMEPETAHVLSPICFVTCIRTAV